MGNIKPYSGVDRAGRREEKQTLVGIQKGVREKRRLKGWLCCLLLCLVSGDLAVGQRGKETESLLTIKMSRSWKVNRFGVAGGKKEGSSPSLWYAKIGCIQDSILYCVSVCFKEFHQEIGICLLEAVRHFRDILHQNKAGHQLLCHP